MSALAFVSVFMLFMTGSYLRILNNFTENPAVEAKRQEEFGPVVKLDNSSSTALMTLLLGGLTKGISSPGKSSERQVLYAWAIMFKA